MVLDERWYCSARVGRSWAWETSSLWIPVARGRFGRFQESQSVPLYIDQYVYKA